MRKRLLAALLACGALQAAVIRGTVVEHQSGRPLARATVTAQPVGGTAGAAQSVRTNNYGIFEFPPLAPGAYLITASRRSFAPVQYGQRSWRGPGTPVMVDQADVAGLNIRLQRYGSVGGTVFDENDVGLPEHDVIVYRHTRPPQIAGRARTDDRGVFRIGGLEPGSYLVRTVGKQYEDGGYLPTFSRETSRIEEAQVADVLLDQQTDVTVRPAPGRLLNVAGQVILSPQAPVTVNLISDMGTVTTVSDGRGMFRFNPLPPGSYELVATGVADRRGQPLAAYRPLSLDRDQTDLRVALSTYPELRYSVEDPRGNPLNPAAVQVLARRKDLAGEGRGEPLRAQLGRISLPPGRWELALEPMTGYYVSDFSAVKADRSENSRPDGWNEVTLAGDPLEVKFVLSPNPGSIRGTVTTGDRLTVAGVPVYLEPYDPGRGRPLGGIRSTRTGTGGVFSFPGLPPGAYRLLSTVEYRTVDSATLDAAGALTVKVELGRETVQDLGQ
jgi:hypothetical protein